MIQTLLAVATGTGVGVGGMNAAHRHDDGERVKQLSATDIKENSTAWTRRRRSWR